MRLPRTLLVASAALSVACGNSGSVSSAERKAIADSLTRQVKAAYDITKPNVEQRLLSLYPDSGRIVSAGAGRIITSRDTLAMGIHAFWTYVGSNMRDPTWIWDDMVFDVLAPNAAVMTATYHVPHHTPRGEAHTIGGAWTAAFQKRGDRWYIIQEHLSDLPAMPDSAMAAMPPGSMPMGSAAPPTAASKRAAGNDTTSGAKRPRPPR